jgi:hypothetical protein
MLRPQPGLQDYQDWENGSNPVNPENMRPEGKILAKKHAPLP